LASKAIWLVAATQQLSFALCLNLKVAALAEQVLLDYGLTEI
jgi:hypothetical protein